MATGRMVQALMNYERAQFAAPKVQPERRRGGPVVVVDRDEDE